MWSARLCVLGTRSVALLDEKPLHAYTNKHRIVGQTKKDFLKSLSSNGWHDLAKECPIHVGTVAPGDMLWIPAKHLVYEEVKVGGDVFGVKWAMLNTRDERLKDFQAIAAQKSTPSGHIAKAILSETSFAFAS